MSIDDVRDYRNELARSIEAMLVRISPFRADIERRLAGEQAVRDCVAEHFGPVGMIAYRSPSEGTPSLPRFAYPDALVGVQITVKHPSHEWKPFEEDETLEYCERCEVCTCCSPEECSEPCTAGEQPSVQYPEVDVFAERMRAELVANAHKGDNWQSMTPRQAWGEISWHLGKLTAALKAEDVAGIRELAADIANGAMMLDHIVSSYDVRASAGGGGTSV